MESLSHLVDVQSAYALADSQCQKLGANHFAYIVLNLPGSRHGQFPFVLSNHPVEWSKMYDERRYLDHDPVIEIGLASLLPFSWNADMRDVFSYRSDDYEASARMSPVQRRPMEEAGQFGLRYGYSIPIAKRSALPPSSRAPNGVALGCTM
ncbi:MAG: hypothetical protein QOD94_2075 [Alphaproteobacteria bacterium]|jgi:hypothetical protein|nr:hypothetical protein [Alphaproteobacteria bacterium]